MRIITTRKHPLIFLITTASLLSGCMTTRQANFQGYDYDTVFKTTLTSACQQKGLIVYGADKATGQIQTQTRGIFGGMEIVVRVNGNAVSITTPGAVNPWPDKILRSVQENMASKKPLSKPSQSTSDDEMTLERQKLELEKERLNLEREKLELEKQKLQNKP